jgi:alkanesulfonate monooxygenase SsuD/methylene tetrahydromethanopterin reductase-like flavin-dependent oxidoreductase (luciferase family)
MRLSVLDQSPIPEPPSGRRAVLGSPETVKRELGQIAKAYDADEVMVVTITHDHAARRRSYELIAEGMIE